MSLEKLIKIYKDNYKKYESYNQNGMFEIREILDTINLCIELSYEEGDSSELDIIKNELYTNILTLYSLISKDYTYELGKIEEEKRKCKTTLKN